MICNLDGCKKELAPRNKSGYCKSHFGKSPSRSHYFKSRVAERRELLNQIKIESGCADCGYRENPVALQFDHIEGDKIQNISTMAGWNYEVILAEIAKCEVVCANCHAIRTDGRRRK